MKNLRLVFNNTSGQKRDITLPMERWIRDWWYECAFVPENGEVPEIAELDNKDILKNFPDYANSFEDIAYKYMWDELHNDFYGDVKAGKAEDNGDSFELWLKNNVNEEKIYV